MYFTQEDYIKIENWLQANSVKDTEFPEASNLSLNEQLTIIQRGENKRVKLEDLVNFLFSQSDSELDTSSTKPIQNQAVARAIYELQNRKFIEIVEELPPTSNAKDNVVYILLDEVGEDNNLFTEWIKVNNTWEKVGEFKADIDLTPYLTKSEAQLIYQIQEKGKGLSTNDYTTSEKNKLASLENYDDSVIRASLEEVETQIESQDALIKDLQDGKANKSGYYPQMSVGFADDLVGRGESVPAEFSFRASGGKSIKDGTAWIKRLKGNSVVWNQNIENVLSSSTSVRAWFPRRGLDYASIDNGEITLSFDAQSDAFGNSVRQRINVKAGDKFFISYDYESHNVDEFGRRMFIAFTSGWSSRGGMNDASNAKGGDVTGHVEAIGVVPSRDDIDSISLYFCYTSITSIDTTPLKVSKFRFVNLTKMFGAEEAAKINTIEDYNARKPIVEDEYAYNEGEVIHMTAEGIKSVGDNAWDEEWELGNINNTGEEVDSATSFRSKNYIRVIPNTQYYFKKPIGILTYLFFYDEDKNFVKWLDPFATSGSGGVFTTPNAPYMRFRCANATYNNDIMLTLVHSGWKQDTDAGYQPYWQDTLPLPIIRKYFPDGMKSAGSAHDEIRYNKASGKWEKVVRIGSVDLGTLKWRTQTIKDANYFASENNTLNAVISDDRKNNERYILCAKYQALNRSEGNTQYDSKEDKVIMLNHGCFGNVSSLKDLITIRDTSYTDAESFKAAMQGVMLYYELAEPIVTELDAEDQNFRDYYQVADFGTEMSQSAVPSAAFSADIIYQFNAVDMIREHEIEINELQSIIATMQAQLASLTSNF